VKGTLSFFSFILEVIHLRLCVDIETNAVDNPDKLWCVCSKDIDTLETKEWTYETGYAGMADYLLMADIIIGHNFISYDAPVLGLLGGVSIPTEKITDTLVLSRLWNYKVVGGHSLEAWGERLKHPKIGLTQDFSTFEPGILLRCRNDVELNVKVFHKLNQFLKPEHFDEAIKVEHRMARICHDMHTGGFGFDIDEARRILSEVTEQLETLDGAILSAFPPKAKLRRVVKPKVTKYGTIAKTGISNWYDGADYSIFSPDSPFSLVDWIPFNPGSPSQIVERLNEAGWRPTSKTKSHIEAERSRDKDRISKFRVTGWKVDETNLATVPDSAPAATKLLVKRTLLAARQRTLNEWMQFYEERTKAVHGSFNHIGTVTHRMSHTRPNLGNVATKKTIKYNSPELRALAIDLGGRMRRLWRAREGCLLVGTDMESAHLRIFAHLIDDPEFTQSLISGRKEDGTDPHSLNKAKLGTLCADRDRAKTFIFSFLNGAASPKVASIFDCSLQDAKRALAEFTEAYPGLQRLKAETMPRDAERGYFVGLDGRLVACAEERLLIGAYLQNAEAVIMKHANVRWQDALDKEGIVYRQVNLVHDEFVTEVGDDLQLAKMVGQIQSNSIRDVGEAFGLRCPLAGEYKIGEDWLSVH
jgi:DNA polymerase-1